LILHIFGPNSGTLLPMLRHDSLSRQCSILELSWGDLGFSYRIECKDSDLKIVYHGIGIQSKKSLAAILVWF